MTKKQLKFTPEHDQIIVLKDGKMLEIGHHQQLVADKNYYFNLVKNQLELGN